MPWYKPCENLAAKEVCIDPTKEVYIPDEKEMKSRISFSDPITSAPKPIKIFVNYCWIIGEIDKRLGKCPDNVKDVLIDLDIQQNEELK